MSGDTASIEGASHVGTHRRAARWFTFQARIRFKAFEGCDATQSSAALSNEAIA
jgi:hypothetical protein